jgi:hypothetical protein
MNCFSLGKKVVMLLLTGVLLHFSSCKSEDDDPKVTANEEIFINEVYASGNDWIEIYNNNSSPKDLTGYKIYDKASDKYTIPGNATIPPEGFLILFANDENNGLNTNFKLTSSGETVYLENPKGDLIDKITFPALLNNQSYARIPDGSATWVITGNPTQGEPNSSAPSITEVSRSPLVPGLADAVTVTTQFASTSGISNVKLFYRIDNESFSSVDMTLSAGIYSGIIPAMNKTGKVDYYIEAQGNSGGSTFRPTGAPERTYNFLLNTDVLPQLRINEFMALNTSCCTDEAGEYEDWIEIHNLGDTDINLANYYMSDDLSNPFNSRIRSTNAAETTIPAKGYIVIWADGDRDQGERHVDFRLNQAGESIGLYYIDGRMIDEHSFGVQTADKSVGRLPNGTGSFQVLASPSPGAANQ